MLVTSKFVFGRSSRRTKRLAILLCDVAHQPYSQPCLERSLLTRALVAMNIMSLQHTTEVSEV